MPLFTTIELTFPTFGYQRCKVERFVAVVGASFVGAVGLFDRHCVTATIGVAVAAPIYGRLLVQ